MKRKTMRRVCWVLAGLAMVAANAGAWGPEAQRSIMSTSLQLLRGTYSQEYFKDTRFLFHDDLIKGAQDGYEQVLKESFQSDSDAVNEVLNQIQLLREVRQYGVGSYFAYRMGVLGALVADLYMPFGIGLDKSLKGEQLRREIDSDVDEHLADIQTTPLRKQLFFMRSPADYFRSDLSYVKDAESIVAGDYARGVGYNGYLSHSLQPYFMKASQAVADVWYTVLYQSASSVGEKPSREAVTWYFVADIEYLLVVKNNIEEAQDAYGQLSRVNPGIVEAYDKVGDYFFKAGAKDRAVQEWRYAASFSGPDRQQIIEKIGRYYVDQGKDLLSAADGPHPPERALDDAIVAFREAISSDPTNSQASDLLNEAQIKLRERNELLKQTIEMVASIERDMKEAGRLANETPPQYEVAITTYNQVIGKANDVAKNDMFPEQTEAAKKAASDAQAAINNIFNKVLDDAQDALDDGDALLERKAFDEASTKYESVPGILSVIPDDQSVPQSEQKKKLSDQSSEKIADVSREKQRFADEQKRLAEQAEQGGAPGATPEAAPGAPGMPTGPGAMPGMPTGPGMMPGMPGMPTGPGMPAGPAMPNMGGVNGMGGMAGVAMPGAVGG